MFYKLILNLQNSFRGGGSFNVFTKVEFQAEILGESSRHELSEGISHVNMDLSVSRVCRIDTNAAVENIMRNPLIGQQVHVYTCTCIK